MSKPISLFSGYSQKENRTTNYCLLILKMLYDENPRFLGEVLSTLLGEDMSKHVGVEFRQQKRGTSSVPDGVIMQRAFTVYIETKNYDWFYDKQLEHHLESLANEASGLNVLLALGKFESDTEHRFEAIKKLCETRFKRTVAFGAVSFDDFVDALELEHLPQTAADYVQELRAYLNESNLLTSWPRWMDVVNCKQTFHQVLDGHAYMCPATGGAYRHGRCKYFGTYRNKQVEYVSEIEAVVDVENEDTVIVKWNNSPTKKVDLQQRAREMVKQYVTVEEATRVFLLGNLYPTQFIKDTKGGMQSYNRNLWMKS